MTEKEIVKIERNSKNKKTGQWTTTIVDYETVASRVKRFREDTDPLEEFNYGIQTELLKVDDKECIIRASVKIWQPGSEPFEIGSGYAHETTTSTGVNSTSALENCETSAIGRALASLGYLGTEYASANEVQNARAREAAATPGTVPAGQLSGIATQKQVKMIDDKKKALQETNPKLYEEFSAWYTKEHQAKPLKQLTKAEASKMIDILLAEEEIPGEEEDRSAQTPMDETSEY